MPENLTDEERALVAKLHVAKEKTNSMKKSLAKKKNMLAARKKEHVSRNLQPPDDLTTFLQADDTFQKVLEEAEKNPQAMIVRR